MLLVVLPSISYLCFLRLKPFQIIQRAGFCAFLQNRSLLPPPPLSNFSEEIVLEAIIVNLRCCRWHDLEQLSPAITDNVVLKVILRCRRSPQQALYFFQWSEQNRQRRKLSPLCLDTYCALIHVLIAAKLFDEGIDLMKKLMQKDCISPLDLLSSLSHVYVHTRCNLSVYDAVVRACTQLGVSNNAYSVIKALMGKAVMVSIHAWNNFLNCVLMLGQEVDDFWMMYQEMLTLGYVENVNTFNLAILALCREFKLLEAFSIISLMIKRNIAPNVVTLNMLVDGCCRKKVDFAFSFDLIKNIPDLFEDKIEPNCVTYNTIINGLCKAGETDFAERVLRKDMFKWGIKPNLRTYSILIDGFSTQKKIDDALRLFVEILDKGLVPNTTVCNSLMNCFLKQGYVEYAWYLLSSMIDNHILPDHFTYSILIEGCLRNGFVKEAFNFHQKLREEDTLCKDIVSCNILINYLCKHGKIKEAKQMLANMITCHLPPDVITYTTLIYGCCKLSKVDDALHIYEGMVKYEQMPNVLTYNTVINGLCKEGSIDIARFILEEMTRTGLYVDVLTYNTLLNAYCSRGSFDDAFSLCFQMRKVNVMENVSTYNVLINFLCKSGLFQLAKNLVKAMVDRGVLPDCITYTTVISSFWKSCPYEVVELHDMLVLEGVTPDDYTYKCIVDPLLGMKSDA